MTIDLFDTYKRRASIADRIDASGDCWEWTGSKNGDGYGTVQAEGRVQGSHRVVWKALVGPIPKGQTLDHLCRNPGCVNPDHLELVTHQENVLRGYNPMAQQSRRTHCVNGHLLSGDNIYQSRLPRRTCIACDRARHKDRPGPTARRKAEDIPEWH